MPDEVMEIKAKGIKNIIDKFFIFNKEMFKAIKYDLTKLKINCEIEEIQALVYNAVKKGIKDADIYDFILERISLTLPQDIIVNLKLARIQTKNFRKIIEFYKKGEHSNFSKFLENLKYKKNIVYTFTKYSKNIIDDSYKINNILIGEIKKENIKIIELNFQETKREFEKYIDDYLNNDNLKICIVKFLPYEGTYMKYVNCYIENKFNISEKYDKKIFIFIVYMSRIFFEELKEKENINKKILSETLSNLSGNYQIFIDNLKGEPKLKIENILIMNGKEIFNNLINPDEN